MSLDNLSLPCDLNGRGPTVVLVHAPEIGGGREEWSVLAPLLAAAGFGTVACDLPGFGDAPPEPRRYGADDMIAGLAGLLDELGIEPCHLVARGLAVGYAAAVAAAQPERVATLTAVAPLGLHPPRIRPDLFEQFTAADVGRARYEELAATDNLRDWLCSEVYEDPSRVIAELVAGLHQRALRPGAEYVFGSLAAGWLSRELRDDWVALTQPLLLLWGESCEDPPLDEAEDYLMPLRRDAPVLRIGGRPVGVWKRSVTYKTFAGARQRPHFEQPAEVAEVLLRHLARGAG